MCNKIIIIKPKSLSALDKQKLAKAGNTVIEMQDLDAIRIKDPIAVQYVSSECMRCGEKIYLTCERDKYLRRTKDVFYCSYGHGQSYK